MEVRKLIPPEKGTDIRDWIIAQQKAGKTREETRAALLALRDESPVYTREKAAEESATADETMLDEMGLTVLSKTPQGKIELYSTETKQRSEIVSIDHLGFGRLLTIGGDVVAAKVTESTETTTNMLTVRQARNLIGRVAARKGERSIHRRGAGVWKSGVDLILCDKEECCVWNGTGQLGKLDSPIHAGCYYESSLEGTWFDHANLSSLTVDPASTIAECVALVGRWRWYFDYSPKLVTGMILATWTQLIWSWRPQVVITGKRHTGKTVFFEMIESIFGGLADNQSDSTLAGIVGSIEKSGVVILLDELDSNPDRQKIFRLIKRAGRGAKRRTGTAQQKSIETTARQIFWCAGIDSGLESATEAERFIAMELLPRRPGDARIQQPSEAECRDLGQRLLKLAIRGGIEAARLAVKLSAIQIKGIADRVIETYSVPVAALAVATGQPGEKILEELIWNERGRRVASQSDEDALRDTILDSHVSVGKGKFTSSVRQLVQSVIDTQSPSELPDEDAADALDKIGIVIRNNEFRISHTAVSRFLLKKTQFERRSIREILLRIGFRDCRGTKGRRLMGIELGQFFDADDADETAGREF